MSRRLHALPVEASRDQRHDHDLQGVDDGGVGDGRELHGREEEAGIDPEGDAAPQRVPHVGARDRHSPSHQVHTHHDGEEQEAIGDQRQRAHVDDLGDHARSAPRRHRQSRAGNPHRQFASARTDQSARLGGRRFAHQGTLGPRHGDAQDRPEPRSPGIGRRPAVSGRRRGRRPARCSSCRRASRLATCAPPCRRQPRR